MKSVLISPPQALWFRADPHGLPSPSGRPRDRTQASPPPSAMGTGTEKGAGNPLLRTHTVGLRPRARLDCPRAAAPGAPRPKGHGQGSGDTNGPGWLCWTRHAQTPQVNTPTSTSRTNTILHKHGPRGTGTETERGTWTRHPTVATRPHGVEYTHSLAVAFNSRVKTPRGEPGMEPAHENQPPVGPLLLRYRNRNMAPVAPRIRVPQDADTSPNEPRPHQLLTHSHALYLIQPAIEC